MQTVVPSTADVSVTIRIVDSTDGTPETGVTSASSGIDLWYRKGATGSQTNITESDLAAVTSSHSDGGMKHIDDGYYRLDLPDAAVPTSEGEVTIVGGGVTGMVVLGTALIGKPAEITAAQVNTEADTALTDYGALRPTTAGRTLDVTATGEAGVDWANVGSPTTTVGLTNTTIGTATAVTAVSTGGITAGSIAADAIGASELAADAVTEIAAGISVPTAAANAAAVWAYATRTLTQGAASVASAVSGSTITAYKGGYLSVTLTGLTDFTGWTRIYVTVKDNPKTDTDAQSVLQLRKTSPSDAVNDGLLYAAGAAATKSDGAITVNSTTSITFTVKNAATALLTADNASDYDVWVINASGQPVPVSEGGKFIVYPSVTIAAS